ncbi:hypothetical protein BLNAU_16931 [Blattamonas nauphoetae]|uniref:Uncharacterized protein n=1 Tax=Blattamonas nauphoetae TaxID=2049346 RepID=A0ABQ9XCW2_9EUKA|nr:hypothetical protein BLNAU_16931 [Blattamonas nauphoetae]
MSPLCCGTHSSGLLAELMKLIEIIYSKSSSFVRSSISSEIPSFIITHFGNCLKCPALESCCSCIESLFFEPEIVDSLFLHHKDLILSTFRLIGQSSPPYAALTTLARLSLFPHLRLAFNSLEALHSIVERDPPALTLLPSPIFPSSYPHQQYSGLSFLAACQKKLRIVWTEFQTNLPTDPSSLPKYVQLTKDDPYIITRSLDFCSGSFFLPILLMNATPRIQVASEIIRDLILFVKQDLTTMLTIISNNDNLIAYLRSASSLTTPHVSEVEIQMINSLKHIRVMCEDFVSDGWSFFVNLTYEITDPHKSSFQSIILDDPSFPDLVLNSIKLNHNNVRTQTFSAVTNIIYNYSSMKQQFMTANLAGRMFETVDFVSLPLSESDTLLELTKFLANMSNPIGDDEATWTEQYRLIRVSVFEPAKTFITFIFNNSDKLVLDEAHKTELENSLSGLHYHITNMELHSDEHNGDLVSELVKWEVRQMVEMENEVPFPIVFQKMLDRNSFWNRDERDRLKRREVLLREEGWDDAFELRVVGIEADTDQEIKHDYKEFRIEMAFNADER